MGIVTRQAGIFLTEERRLQAMRVEAAGNRLSQVKRIAVIGGPIVALLKLLVSVLLIRNIRGPIATIDRAMTAFGRGERDTRVTARMGSIEFEQLARGYNDMAGRLDKAIADQGRSEQDLQAAHLELIQNSRTLRDRGEVIELLGGMAHRMQAARTDDELAQVIRLFVPRVLPGVDGILYTHNNSRNLLVPIASWGDMALGEPFAPDQCWALRRGQSHAVTAPGGDIVCGHVPDDRAIYHCEPLLAGGEVIGTLHLRGRIEAENRFRLTVMVENIASALVNHRLQRGLREQTIRDPLTGLFNRRYMEEALALELARASRSGQPLSLIMCDVDHFKRFNDEFGHDAGDAVLQAISREMRSRFRGGDIVCRYGGEEFTVIAPGTSAAHVKERVETVRRAVADLDLRASGRRLGRTSMSFGIAEWTRPMPRDGAALLQAADAALYRAKREGRDRIVLDLPGPDAAAA